MKHLRKKKKGELRSFNRNVSGCCSGSTRVPVFGLMIKKRCEIVFQPPWSSPVWPTALAAPVPTAWSCRLSETTGEVTVSFTPSSLEFPILFATLILNPSCRTFTSSIPKSSRPTGGAGVPQPGLRRRQHGSDPHPAHACGEDLHLQLQATAAGGGQGCSHSCRDAPGAAPPHHRER